MDEMVAVMNGTSSSRRLRPLGVGETESNKTN